MEESLKIFVVEDSREAAESLEILSKVIEEGIQFVYHAMSIREALQEIPKQSFNVLVLDVTLPDGSGFDLLEQLGPISYPVIIMTGDDTSAITAIRHQAFDYWVKPINIDDLRQTY
ncbi:MAG: response regulator, partial [Bacteroidota bacterium]|nr:response regulator [Bacteroidota bacterium]